MNERSDPNPAVRFRRQVAVHLADVDYVIAFPAQTVEHCVSQPEWKFEQIVKPSMPEPARAQVIGPDGIDLMPEPPERSHRLDLRSASPRIRFG
jgi:hypothetical protein